MTIHTGGRFVQRHRHALFMVAVVLSVVLFSEQLVASRRLMHWVDAHAPVFKSASTVVHIQKQMLHMELTLRDVERTRVVFLGSSSVVNGVDESLIAQTWKACGLDWGVRNYGALGMLAYELPMLEKYWAAPNTVVVYLYNTFSFADRPLPDTLPFRWSTAGALRVFTPAEMWRNRVAATAGMAGELLALVRYGELYREMSRRVLTGTAVLPHSPYDNDPRREEKGARVERMRVTPLPREVHLRAAYLDSESGGDTLGYRALRRFMQMTEERGQVAIIGPVPAPDFALWTSPYSVGTNPDRVHEHVSRLLEGRPVLGLERLEALDFDDTLFLDFVHLNAAGRARYSDFLARRVPELMARRLPVQEGALRCLADHARPS